MRTQRPPAYGSAVTGTETAGRRHAGIHRLQAGEDVKTDQTASATPPQAGGVPALQGSTANSVHPQPTASQSMTNVCGTSSGLSQSASVHSHRRSEWRMMVP